LYAYIAYIISSWVCVSSTTTLPDSTSTRPFIFWFGAARLISPKHTDPSYQYSRSMYVRIENTLHVQ